MKDLGASPAGDRATRQSPSPTVSALRASIPSAGAQRWGGAPDDEVAELMHKLSQLQIWCALMTRHDSGGIPAAQLIQDTRCLIVERLYPRAAQAIEARSSETRQGLDPKDESAVDAVDAPIIHSEINNPPTHTGEG